MKSKEFLLSLAPDQKIYIYGYAGFTNIPEQDAIEKWRFRTPKGLKAARRRHALQELPLRR